MDFTYQNNDTTCNLETYEWDNTWLDQADDTKTKRVLYIGDSISCGIRNRATKASEGSLLYDGFGTSKSLDNPFFMDSLRIFGEQQGYRSVILFNNGLHGWHLDDEILYPMYYGKMLDFLISEFPGVPVAVVLTTSVINNTRNQRVIKRNDMAKKVSKQHEIPVIDLFSLSENISVNHADDGIHFTNEGYEILAQNLNKEISKLIMNNEI